MAFPVGCCLGRRGGFACRATVSPLHDHRIVLTAPLCYTVAMPICCGCHCYCRTAPPHRSVTAPLLPLRYCRDAAPLRYFRACLPPPRRSAAAAWLSCCCPTPPHRFATAALLYTAALLRSAPLCVTLRHAASSAPRRLEAWQEHYSEIAKSTSTAN